MNNDLAHADTLRPPAPNPWLDAPTHDGLWWMFNPHDAEPMTLIRVTNGRAEYMGSDWVFDTKPCDGSEDTRYQWANIVLPSPPLP